MIVAFTLPAMAHVKPVVPLLSGLVEKQHKIVCFGHEKFEPAIRSSGAEFRPYPRVAYDVEAPDFNLVRMGADLMRASQTIYPHLVAEVAAMSPRLILQDFMAPWASRIGTTLAIPRIHTVPTLVFNAATERLMQKEDGFVKLAGDVTRGLPHLLREMVRSKLAFSLREAFGLERSWRRLVPPICEIIFSIEELQTGPPQGDVPRHYIGHPFAPSRDDEQPGVQGYCLITFGTLSNTDTRRFEAAMRGVLMAGLSAVAICGRKVDVAHLAGVARELETAYPGRRAMALDWVPQIEPWLRGADVVMHHAGMATTWDTFRQCKPALFIPTNADQKVFASKLELNGLGVRLPRGHELEPKTIADNLLTARKLDCPFEHLHARIAEAGGAKAGVDIILRALETRQ